MKSLKKITVVSILATCLFLCLCVSMFAIEVISYFSPLGGCSAKICEQIDAGRESIQMAAYQLTSKHVCDSLIRAKSRRLDVAVIVDAGLEERPDVDLINLMREGVVVRVDRGEKLFHNKYVVIDGQTTITGSYNFSDNAELRNAENIVIIKDKDIAASFAADFNRHLRHSTSFRNSAAIKENANNRLALPIQNHNSPRKKEP